MRIALVIIGIPACCRPRSHAGSRSLLGRFVKMKMLALSLGQLAAVFISTAQPPPLNIAGSDNVGIKVAVDSAEFSESFLVQAVDSRGAKDVKVKVNPLVGPGQRWVQPHAEWRIEKKAVPSETPQDIEGLGERTLNISLGLPVPGMYVGTIDLIYENNRHTYKFEIERPPDPPLLIRDKEFSVELATLAAKTAIQSKGLNAVRNVEIEVHDLIGPDARQITPQFTINGKLAQSPVIVDMPPNGQVAFTYNADLPIPGKYMGAIDLIYGLQRQTETLTVTRVDAKVPLGIRPIESTETQNWPWFADEATVRVVLEGSRAETITLSRPMLSTFSRKESEKVNKSAVYGGITIQQVGPEGKLCDVSNKIELIGRTPLDLRVTIPGLSAGEYSGTFSTVADGFSPQEATFTVYVRNSFMIAGFLIALSVYLSYRLRLWAILYRPKLLAQRQIVQLSADVDATRAEVTDASSIELRVLDSFSQRLAKLFSDSEDGTITGTDTIVKEVGDKLTAFGKWINLRRGLEKIELPLLTIRGLRERLNAFGSSFEDKNVEAKTISDGIAKLSADLSAALGVAMTAMIERIRADIVLQKTTVIGKVYADKLDQEVESRLKIATDLAKSDDSLAEAVLAYEDASLIYTRILADGFEAQLPSRSPDPQIISEDQWNKVKAVVKEDLNVVRRTSVADVAGTAYAAAYSNYLRTLLDAAQVRLDASPEKVARSTLNSAEKNDIAMDLNNANQARLACAALLASHDVTMASAKYEQLKQTMLKIQSTLKNGGQEMKISDGSPLTGPAQAIQIASAPFSVWRAKNSTRISPQTGRILLKVADLTNKIRRGEAIVAWVTGIVTVLMGIKLLWIPSPTWGEPSDWITAILWGLGLHQVAGAALGQFDWSTMLTKLAGSGGTDAKG